MISNEKSNFQNKITIKYERAVMSGSIRVKDDYFDTLQNQLTIKNERPARLELTINDKLNINKNGILYLEKELISEILEYKFFIPLLWENYTINHQLIFLWYQLLFGGV